MGMKIKTGLVVLVLTSRCMAGDIEDFVGGVYKSRAVVVSETMAITPEGVINKVGDNYITPRGFYGTCENVTYGGGQGVVSQNGDFFYGGGSIAIRAGNSYIGEDGINYVVNGSHGVSSSMRKP